MYSNHCFMALLHHYYEEKNIKIFIRLLDSCNESARGQLITICSWADSTARQSLLHVVPQLTICFSVSPTRTAGSRSPIFPLIYIIVFTCWSPLSHVERPGADHSRYIACCLFEPALSSGSSVTCVCHSALHCAAAAYTSSLKDFDRKIGDYQIRFDNCLAIFLMLSTCYSLISD